MTSFARFVGRWGLVVVWLPLPATLGAALSDALADATPSVAWVIAVAAWAAWVLVLGAALVPSTVSLTIVRVLAPAAAAVALATVTAAGALPVTIIGLANGIAVAIVALAAPVADTLVDGSSYGDERRFALRTPAPLLLGPVEITWAFAVAGPVTGPLLAAAGAWAAAVAAALVGWPLAVVGWRSQHQLSRRWVVFVPAGFVLHDLLAMGDALLVPRRLVAGLHPAGHGTTATDLTLGARGVPLEVAFTEPTPVGLVDRHSAFGRPTLRTTDASAVLFAPMRPGAVLAEAHRRRVPIG